MKVNVLKEIDPENESCCGSCPNVYPGPADDYCGVFGDVVVFVGNDHGKYRRLFKCLDAQRKAECHKPSKPSA